jgi:uncharacterized repeat protein (TIGR01451 family)
MKLRVLIALIVTPVLSFTGVSDADVPTTLARSASGPARHGDGQGAGGDEATAVTTVPEPLVDLVISQSDAPDPVELGGLLTYTIRVQNKGPDTATGVTVRDLLPRGVILHSVGSSQGSCVVTGTDQPVVGIAGTPSGGGYWVAAADGSVFGFGDARLFGSAANSALSRPLVGMAATPTGNGYWLVASDGGVFAFGNAGFYGSTGAIHLNQPIVGMVSTPTGNGYWLVASDGGVFAFGDALFHGSTGGIRLNQPVVGLAGTPTGNGYWLVASDGGVFAFGDAGFLGSVAQIGLQRRIVGIAASRNGGGYWLVASDGGVFPFGDLKFLGSTSGVAANGESSVVGIAARPTGDGFWLASAMNGVFAQGAAPGLGTMEVGRKQLTCDLQSLPMGAGGVVTARVIAAHPGPIVNSATVSSNERDLDIESNNAGTTNR